MKVLLDIYSAPQGPENERELLASLDVTANTGSERAAVLAGARDQYGPACAYFWHDCGHNENRPCTRLPAVLRRLTDEPN